MSRPLSDKERSAIDMRRVDDALAAIVDTPLDELDESKLIELDRALTPGNMRKPIEVPRDAPVEPSSKRAAHHEVGGIEEDELDEFDEFSPTRWEVRKFADNSPTADIGTYRTGENPRNAEATSTESASRSDVADDFDASSLTHTHSRHIDAHQDYPPVTERQSTDPGLNLTAGLQDLLFRRRQSASTVSSAQPCEQHEETSASTVNPSSTEPNFPESGQHLNTSVGPDIDVERNPAHSAPPKTSVPWAHDDSPIPLRSTRGSTDNSSSSKLEELRSRFDGLEAGKKKKLKFLAAGLVAIAVLSVVQSWLPAGGDSASEHHLPTAATAESAAAPPTASQAIPVPDSAIGVLAPTTVSARCPDGSTDARLAFNSDKSKAWICERALGIDGAVLEMSFPHPVVVTDVFLIPGFDYIEPSGIDRWVEHRVVTRAQWSIGGQRFIQEINPSRSGASMKIPAVETQKITLTIMQTAEPSESGLQRGFNFDAVGESRDDSFAISLIRITGHQP